MHPEAVVTFADIVGDVAQSSGPVDVLASTSPRTSYIGPGGRVRPRRSCRSPPCLSPGSSPRASLHSPGGSPAGRGAAVTRSVGSAGMLVELRRCFCELQACVVTDLDQEGRLAFWLNVLNAATLTWVCLTDNLKSGWIPVSTWVSFLQRSRVNVGGHEYSLFAIEHSMLRAQSQTVGRLWSFFQGQHLVRPCDPRAVAALQRPAPEVSFGLAYPVRAGCAPLRVYRPEAVKPQLLLNCAHYLTGVLRTEPQRRRLCLPPLFKHYLRDFASSSTGLVEFTRSVLLAVPSALEAVQRLTGRRASRADAALVGEARRAAAKIEALGEAPPAAAAGPPPCLGVADARPARQSAGPRSSQPLNFSGVTVWFSDFDWKYEFPARSPVCPELEEELRKGTSVAFLGVVPADVLARGRGLVRSSS